MRFVVVNGPPGAGKSTLAEPLARTLGLPLIAKDTIKEALGDALEVGGEEWTQRLSNASFEVLFAIAPQCREAVLEGNFYAPSRDRLRRLDPSPLEVFCRCPINLCRDRFARRLDVGRHRVHPPVIPPAAFFEQFDQPLGLGPVLTVATDQRVDIAAVAAWIADQRNAAGATPQ